MSDAAESPVPDTSPPRAVKVTDGNVTITVVDGRLDLTPEEREHARLDRSVARKAEERLRPLIEATDNPEKLDAFEALLALARRK